MSLFQLGSGEWFKSFICLTVTGGDWHRVTTSGKQTEVNPRINKILTPLTPPFSTMENVRAD